MPHLGRQRQQQRQRAQAADEHRRDNDRLGGNAKAAGHAGGQAHRATRAAPQDIEKIRVVFVDR